jgi:cobalt-zinc-cadmium efflux system membrane fusion protein
MKKVSFKLSITILGLIIFLNACINGDSKPVGKTAKVEALPENIVELREDQIKLAGIQTGSVEMRSVSNTLKVLSRIQIFCRVMPLQKVRLLQ